MELELISANFMQNGAIPEWLLLYKNRWLQNAPVPPHPCIILNKKYGFIREQKCLLPGPGLVAKKSLTRSRRMAHFRVHLQGCAIENEGLIRHAQVASNILLERERECSFPLWKVQGASSVFFFVDFRSAVSPTNSR